MEKEILEILKRLETKVDGIEKKLDGVVEQTADLLEFRSEIINKVDGIREDLSTVELVTANNYKDIAKLKAVIVILASLPVPLSTADTLTIPFASISKVTSI